jgi:hypothetical protein
MEANFSDLEINLCMNHLGKRWREIYSIKDEQECLRQMVSFQRKIAEFIGWVDRALDSPQFDEEMKNGQKQNFG